MLHRKNREEWRGKEAGGREGGELEWRSGQQRAGGEPTRWNRGGAAAGDGPDGSRRHRESETETRE